MRTRVKICGITRPADAVTAAASGADAIGLVFYAKSPRAVQAEAARAIVAALPPLTSVVGLFVNAPAEQVRAVLAAVPIDVLQFHGGEEPDYCAGFGRRYIKAVAMRNGVEVAERARYYASASALLLDTYSERVPGGTGAAFDWRRVPHDAGMPIILAGGLDPDNVAEAIHQVGPYGVDVSSGVEHAKGVKDAALIEAFMRGVSSVKAD